VIFRVPELANGIDDLLAARGYARLAPSRTLFGSLEKLTDDSVNVVIEEEASENWLTARDRLGDSDAQTGRFYRAAIDAITLPSAFASVLVDGRVASLAFGVLESDLLVVESVRTDATLRGRGLARECLTGLFGWAKGRSATSVALQVLADNEPALALYAGLGLSCDLYGYHYRIKPS
jgi:ribosomal protein S18 acetylase RimI-like enzyme